MNKLTHWMARLAAVVVFCFFVFSSAFAGDVIVGGSLTEDQTWTPDNTYIIVQDLRIGLNITLTILPGVTVKIDQGRGIHVWGGNFIVGDPLGVDQDTVHFTGNYRSSREGWKWKGILIQGVGDENTIRIFCADIQDAEIAVDVLDAGWVAVLNSTIRQNQQLGIKLTNCSRCLIQNCVIDQNYDGIEMVATGNQFNTNNYILDNRIINTNHNIYLLKEADGIFTLNLIANNLIQGANNGIWMDNNDEGLSSDNIISNNYFVANGSGFGFGVLLAFDSTQVSNNIFWLNNSALIFDPEGSTSHITGNSFYQNNRAIQIGRGSYGDSIITNTFSAQHFSDFETKETTGTVFSYNNLFPANFQQPVAYNHSSFDMSVKEVYWGTAEEVLVDSLIWDYQDNPALGKFYRVPFLAEPDTTFPISPPTGVIKQWVGDQVKLSWKLNPEKDLKGYRVYSGGFEYYHFGSTLDVGHLQTVFIDASVYDSIAVTAYDAGGNTENAQLAGFESPFSFASYFPYAGENNQYCISQAQIQLNNSTAPFSYEQLLWKTSGDGTFNNPTMLHPTYFPGTQDLSVGTVVLSMNVFKESKWLSDSLELSILEDVIVLAGNDTTIFVDDSLNLVQAEESNASNLFWTSSGDGVFVDDTLLHTTYIPGIMDKATGVVELTLMGQNVCGEQTGTLTLTLVPRFTIHGAVWQDSQIAESCAIVAFDQFSSPSRAASMVNTDDAGRFLFDRLVPGEYLLYAVPDTSLKDSFFPGYYVVSPRWQQAYLLKLDADIYDVDILLPPLDYLLPDGNGKISGHFVSNTFSAYQHDVYTRSWFEPDMPEIQLNEGQSNITILLYTSGREKVLDYTLTDANGNFYFNHLPMGSYVVDAEKAGYLTVVSPVITLTPENPVRSNLELLVDQKKISIQAPGDVNPVTRDEWVVFPNPTNSLINILPKKIESGTYHIGVYDVFGRKVMTGDWTVNPDDSNPAYHFSVSTLHPGIYFGVIIGVNSSRDFSFIVR